MAAETGFDAAQIKLEQVSSEEKKVSAQKAHQTGDVEASKAVHAKKMVNVEEHAYTNSEYIKSLVFGGLDGIITTFAVVAAVAGAEMDNSVVILMGIANLVSDGISMGLGDFLSAKSEKEYIKSEWKRETWEMENYKDGEVEEMIEIYVDKKKMTPEDAKVIIETYAKYPTEFVNLMMVDELELEPFDPDEDGDEWKQGLVMMFSFWFFGAIPVIGFAIIDAIGGDDMEQSVVFALDCVVTMLTMFGLGAAKAKVTNTSIIQQGFLMCVNGALACGAGYLISWALSSLLKEEDCANSTP